MCINTYTNNNNNRYNTETIRINLINNYNLITGIKTNNSTKNTIRNNNNT